MGFYGSLRKLKFPYPNIGSSKGHVREIIKWLSSQVSGSYAVRVKNLRQELAVPARGITSVKFSNQISRRDVEIRQQYYIVALTKGS